MNKSKRRPFFIKDNFQLSFIAGFIALLFIEIMLADFFIYELSRKAVEDAAFSSHLSLERSAQILGPIILKVNICFIAVTFLLAVLTSAAAYYRLHIVFAGIVEGFNKLKKNNTSVRLKLRGTKPARELIGEFNKAAESLDKRAENLTLIMNSLDKEKELNRLTKLHNELCAIIAEK